MPEKFVTVASYTQPIEAQLAKGRLEDEGIKAFLTGDLTLDTFSGFIGMGGQIQLQVPEADAERAGEILSVIAEEERIDEDWENRAEDAAGVWTCSLCGTPVENEASVCPSCETPREAVKTGPASFTPRRLLQMEPEQAEEGIQKREEVTGQPLLPLEKPEQMPESDLDLPPLETFLGDDLARRAYLSALFGAIVSGVNALFVSPILFLLTIAPFTVYSLWLLGRLAFFTQEVSSRGLVKIYLAIGLNAMVACFVFFLVIIRLL